MIGLLRSNRRSDSGPDSDSVPSSLIEAAQWNALFLSGEDDSLLEKLEQRLAASHHSDGSGVWETAVNSLSDGLCVTDSRGIIKAANRAAEAIIDRRSDRSLIGGNLIEILQAISHSQTSDNESGEQLESRLLGISQRLVCEFRRGTETADGVLRVTRTLLDWNREDAGFVWAIRDVTQQKLVEEVREQFVHTATHELRTPLGSLKACAETLAMADDIDIEQQKMFCNLIHTEKQLVAAQARIPETAQESEFLAQVSRLAKDTGLTIQEFRPGGITERKTHRELDVALSALGGYRSLCEFLAGLEKLPRLCRVTSLTVNRDTTPTAEHYPVRMNVVVYFQPLTSETGAPNDDNA